MLCRIGIIITGQIDKVENVTALCIYRNVFFFGKQRTRGETVHIKIIIMITETLSPILIDWQNTYQHIKCLLLETCLNNWTSSMVSCFWNHYQLVRFVFNLWTYFAGFIMIPLLLTRKLLNQGLLVGKLKSSLRHFYGRRHDLVNYNPVLSSFMTYHRIINKSNMMGFTSGTGTAYPSEAPEFTSDF